MNKRIKDIKEKYNKSNKYVLYVNYDDIGLLFNYIDYLENRGDEMGHDLDDDELKATRKFYNLNKIEKHNKVHIPLIYTPKQIDDFINKVDASLYNSNSYDMGVGYEKYKNIMNELLEIRDDYALLYYKHFNDSINNHIPHID